MAFTTSVPRFAIFYALYCSCAHKKTYAEGETMNRKTLKLAIVAAVLARVLGRPTIELFPKEVRQ